MQSLWAVATNYGALCPTSDPNFEAHCALVAWINTHEASLGAEKTQRQDILYEEAAVLIEANASLR